MDANPLSELENLSKRFLGVTLENRRWGTNWPKKCRAKLMASKNERYDYRIEVFGDTLEEAARELIARVREIDAA